MAYRIGAGSAMKNTLIHDEMARMLFWLGSLMVGAAIATALRLNIYVLAIAGVLLIVGGAVIAYVVSKRMSELSIRGTAIHSEYRKTHPTRQEEK